MKKFVLAFLLIPFFGFAQFIPNPSFETWVNYPNGAPHPDLWQTTDQLLNAGFASQEISVKCDGNYSLKLTSRSTIVGIQPGGATNGTLNSSTFSVTGGTPINYKPVGLSACMSYTPGTGDMGSIGALLTKWNSSTDVSDTVAFAIDSLTTTAWNTSYTLNFHYIHWELTPDTILVWMTSSRGLNNLQNVAGSTMTIDNVQLFGINGVTQQKVLKSVGIYPNPANESVNINVQFNQQARARYELMDQTGRVVAKNDLTESQTIIPTSSLSNGLYMLMIRDEAGEKIYQGSVSIAH